MIINQFEKNIQIKMVFYGPAMSGKTTTLKALFNHFGKKENVKSIESSIGRTLYFDFGTISFQNDKWALKIYLYTTTGQDFYLVTRPTVLRAVDGIIFVVDSQKEAHHRNLNSWKELLSYFDIESFNNIAKIITFNKQDLPEKFDSKQFLKEIDYGRFNNIDWKYTIAISSEGILDTFEENLKMILENLYRRNLVTNSA